MKRFKGENKGAFSQSRAIIALSVFGIATTCIPIAISSYNAEIKSLYTINSASKKLLCDLYKKYEYANAVYAANDYERPLGDPFVMDLDGDGVIEISSPENGIYFDFNADGFAEKMAWTTKGDGILAIDINQNGKIDNNLEIIQYN